MTRKRKACEVSDMAWDGEEEQGSVVDVAPELHVEGRQASVVGREGDQHPAAGASTFTHGCMQDSEVVDDPVAEPRNQNENDNNSMKVKKKKHLTSAAQLKKIKMSCEWNMCTAVFNKVERFISHMAEHLMAITGPVSGDGYVCYWRECDFACSTKEEMNRHVFFHGFHCKIKSIGALLMEEKGEKCILDSSGRNLIPEIPEAFQCMWEDCDVKFSSANDFYCHVLSHVKSTDLDVKKNAFSCAWEGCTQSFRMMTRLRDHVRSHTQEKIVGCPNCGGIYASNTKFFDHCIRQIPLDSQQYQCSHCSRRYANERLLRDHVRHHINHYKCPECDMTVPNKSALAVHVRYRHRKEKPHKCLQCGKSFKGLTDVTRHLSVHSVEPAYTCPFQNCIYESRSVSAMNRHIRVVHNGLQKNHYACHVCDSKFIYGINLTKHLIKIHNFQWPVGHTRFRYKQDEDGFYRLQTVRYESIELNQEVNEEGGEEGGACKSQEEDVDSPAASTVPSSPASHTSQLNPREAVAPQLSSNNDDWENQDPQRRLSKKETRCATGKVIEYLEVIYH